VETLKYSLQLFIYLHRPWSDTGITEPLGFRNKSFLTIDPNTKHSICNSKASNPSGLKLLEIFLSSNFESPTPQCSTHCTPDGRGDVLDIVVHQNDRLSEFIVTDVLDSGHLPIMLSILDPVTMKEALIPVENLKTGTCFKASSLKSHLQIS
jgi:hypothetical protein